jgi:hypothetical protein
VAALRAVDSRFTDKLERLIALNSLLGAEERDPLQPHHRPAAKRVIYLFQSGGPSQVDLFDYKPALEKFHGTDVFAHVAKKGRLTGFTDQHKIHPIIASKYKFSRQGQCGSWSSELVPHLGAIADELCTIRSLSTTPARL